MMTREQMKKSKEQTQEEEREHVIEDRHKKTRVTITMH